MSLKLVTAATTYPVTLAEAKLHCRIDSSDEDTLITALITAATEMAEQHTGRAIMAQTWELTQDTFDGALVLTRVPVQSVTSVTYLNESGNLIVLDALTYDLHNSDDYGYASITPAYGTFWPDTREHNEAVAVRYVAGYANATSVPEGIKQWIKLMISTMYDNRETESYSSRAVSTTVKMQFVDRLLDRYVVQAL